MEFIKEILEWPAIIQGILGSFLFWAIFKLGDKIIAVTSKKFQEDKELGSYWGRSARDSFYKDEKNITHKDLSFYAFFICLYSAFHYFLKFALAIFISSIINDFIPIFGYVGYIIAFYFIFRAISYVTHFNIFDKEEKKR